jgi:hypothetical protein
MKNKKLFLTILTAATRPINVRFSENFVINNRMLLFVSEMFGIYYRLKFVTIFLFFIDIPESVLGHFSFSQCAVKTDYICIQHIIN